MKFIIARDEGGMTVLPDHPDVRDFLTLHYRVMIKAGRQTRFDNLVEPMYKLISAHGQAALQSHQGFWLVLKKHLESIDHTVVVQDMRRQILDHPNLAAAVRRLKPYQRPWIIKALLNGNSGLIGGPTRFGKSYGIEALCNAFPKAKTVISAPGIDLCGQLYDHLKEALPLREVKGVYHGSKNSKQSDDITVCSIDSLEKMDPDDTDLLILDEPHAAVSDERMPKVAMFNRARKYGFGATLTGRFDKKDRLIEGLIGPVISNVTYLEGVEMKAISPLKVIFIEIPFSKDTVPGNRVDRDVVYKRLLTESSRTAALVQTLLHDVIPWEWQTMAFIRDEKQAEFYLEHAILPPGEILPTAGTQPAKPAELLEDEEPVVPCDDEEAAADEEDPGVTAEPEAPQIVFLTKTDVIKKVAEEKYGTIAMAKRLTNKARKKMTAAIAANEIKRVLASNIYVQGVTFPDLRVVINLAGGGANTTAIQKPGRLLQIRPNKNYGVMVDFVFKCRDEAQDTRSNPPYNGIIVDCRARHKAYKDIGYGVEFIDLSKPNARERVREIILGAYSENPQIPNG